MIEWILGKIKSITGEYFWIYRLKGNQNRYRKLEVNSFERKLRVLLHEYYCRKINSYIRIDTDISNVFFYHGARNVFIRKNVIFKGKCIIFQNVTIGDKAVGGPVNDDGIPISDPGKFTVIGEDVLIGANSVIVGDISIGAGAKIAAGATVAKDIPAGATVVCKSTVLLS